MRCKTEKWGIGNHRCTGSSTAIRAASSYGTHTFSLLSPSIPHLTPPSLGRLDNTSLEKLSPPEKHPYIFTTHPYRKAPLIHTEFTAKDHQIFKESLQLEKVEPNQTDKQVTRRAETIKKMKILWQSRSYNGPGRYLI